VGQAETRPAPFRTQARDHAGPAPALLNYELRGSDHNPRNERECARIQQDMKNESGYGTLPIY